MSDGSPDRRSAGASRSEGLDVSIIVPTRNRSGLLPLTLGSVFRQRGVTVEVLVIDEASTDETPALLGGIADSRLRVIRHDVPRGVSGARNHGVEAARGTWIAFLDDDDIWAPDKLRQQLQAATTTGRDWVYAGTVNFTGNRVIHGRPPMAPEAVVAALPRFNAIPAGASNVIVRRDTLLRAGPFDARLRNTEDWEMWIRLSKAGPPACVCHPLVGYRMHASTSSLNVFNIEQGARLIETIHDTTVDWGRFHWWIAQLCLRNGQRAAAMRYYAKAAIGGQGRNVRSDVSRLVTHWMGRRLTGGHTAVSVAHPAWQAEAQVWLDEALQARDCA